MIKKLLSGFLTVGICALSLTATAGMSDGQRNGLSAGIAAAGTMAAAAAGVPSADIVEVPSTIADATLNYFAQQENEMQSDFFDGTIDAIGDAKDAMKTSLDSAMEKSLSGAMGYVDAFGEAGNNVTETTKNVRSKLDAMSYPIDPEKYAELSQAELSKITEEQGKAIEAISTENLAKSWLAQQTAANAAETVGVVKADIDGAKTQVDVLMGIIRIQDATSSDLTGRMDLMSSTLTDVSMGIMRDNI